MRTELSYYDLLGIQADSSQEAVRAAFKKAQRANHPDLIGDHDSYATARSSLLNEAYRILKDPGRRAAYDRALAQASQPASSIAQPPVATPRAAPSEIIYSTPTSPRGRRGFRRWGLDWIQERSVWGWLGLQYKALLTFLWRRSGLVDATKVVLQRVSYLTHRLPLTLPAPR